MRTKQIPDDVDVLILMAIIRKEKENKVPPSYEELKSIALCSVATIHARIKWLQDQEYLVPVQKNAPRSLKTSEKGRQALGKLGLL